MVRRERCERRSTHGTPMVPPREAGQMVNRLTITEAIIAESNLSCLGACSRKLGGFCTFAVHLVLD